GPQLFFGRSGFENEQRAELRIAVLLDDKTDLVLRDECLNTRIEGESPYAHHIGEDAILRQEAGRFANGLIAAAEGDETDGGRGLGDHRRRDELRRRLVFARQPVYHLLVFIRYFGVSSGLRMAGAPGEVRRFRIHARERARGYRILVFVVVTLELRELLDLL